MHVVVVGLNYQTAPVEVREQFTWKTEELGLAVSQLKETTSILECVIVSTCNRTEIYAVVDKLERYTHYIRSFMEKWFKLPREQFKPFLYTYTRQDAVRHLFKVVTGLDSLVLGETQILGQVRDAFLTAQRLKATGAMFNMLFKQAITFAKRAHYETGISENPVSISTAAIELGKKVIGSYSGKHVMILGAGKMSELAAKYLAYHGVQRLIVVNRTAQRASELAAKYNGEASSMEELSWRLAEVDVVISCTSSENYVITLEMVEAALKLRQARPLVMIDIAVPRDIDPAVAQLPNVQLFNMNHLESAIEGYLEDRRKEADKVIRMIDGEIEMFETWMRTLGVSPVIQALQMKSAMIHEETMQSLLKKLPDLDERQVKVIQKLTKSIVNQMMRDPILRIKEMSAGKERDEALAYFCKIFALEELLWADNQDILERSICDEAAPVWS
jgi:glutamyl-tRNA reductase